MNILCWQGYEDADFVAPFERRFGEPVQGQCFASDMEAVNRIRQERHWDLVNINNPYADAILHPENLIVPLDTAAFAGEDERLLPKLRKFFDCAWTEDGSAQLGICQRFGPFNLVINRDLISAGAARSEGFLLGDDPGHEGHFGLLDYPEFNVMHAAIACAVDPFAPMTANERQRVSAKLTRWKKKARLFTSDHHALNEALIAGDIRFYISGGTYTGAVARLDGHSSIEAVTPSAGPAGGRGGIAFVEVTCLCRSKRPRQAAENFLHFMLEPAQCHRIAFAKETHNPVAQMGDAKVMERFSAKELNALQWDNLEEDMSRCMSYALIPEFEQVLS